MPKVPGIFRNFFPIFVAIALSFITIPAGAQSNAPTEAPKAEQPAAAKPADAAPAPPKAEAPSAPPAADTTRPEPTNSEQAKPQAPAPGATPDQTTTAAGDQKSLGSSLIPHDLSPYGMFMNADIVVKVVMVGLAFASLVTWTILLVKTLELFGARARANQALSELANAQTLGEGVAGLKSPKAAVTRLAQAALSETERSRGLPAEGVKERAAALLGRIETRAGRTMGRGTGLLATIGSTAPFVGLFGTVWGIMNSFIGISKTNTTNLAVVAPGIAEALLATAFGLVAAIPAVIIYNMFARGITGYRAILGDASTEILRLLSRDLDRETGRDGLVPSVAMKRQAAE